MDEWGKDLTRSDAQRKERGHQRGSITLVKGFREDIDVQRYFRHTLFANAAWETERTATGQPLESAQVMFIVEIEGRDVGVHELTVTHAPNREAGQSNYTSLLHLGSLAPHFAAGDFTGRYLRIRRMSDGTFLLSIG